MVESNKTAADTYSLAIFRAIRRLQQAAEIHSKRLSRYGGLTPLQLLILHVLAVEGELTATQLAKLVSLSQASLSGVLDRLEGRGLLYRRRDEQDRRKSWLHLDPAGHEALAEAPPLLPEYVIERFAALPEWERHGLLARGRPVRPAGRGRRRRVRAPGSLRKTVASAVFTWRTCRCLAGAGWWTSALRLSALHHGVTSA
ncbi:TPA: MarR family transcriptional regulator [Pseudomonas aeruginosa]|nr:MarR family transcriptional regulator [Pseudomonas aeruginosa]